MRLRSLARLLGCAGTVVAGVLAFAPAPPAAAAPAAPSAPPAPSAPAPAPATPAPAPATPASAAPSTSSPAVTSGWWNALSAQGQAAPSPTTAAGDLHISAAPGQTLALAAVRYPVGTSAGSATLQLAVAGTQNTGNVVACPTTTVTWRGGDDQPSSAAPAYNCSTASYPGLLSADGKTLTFLLDTRAEPSPGVLSVAILPVQTSTVPEAGEQAPVATTEPFSIDLAAPTAADLVVTGSGPDTPAPFTAPAPAGGPPPAAPAGPAPAAPASLSLPTATGEVAPLNPGPGSAPVVALGPATGTPTASGAAPALAPAAATTPASRAGHDAALALLIAFALVVLASAQQPRRAPRLLAGPHARLAAAAAPSGGEAGAARGVGRFSRVREGRPRPLL